jgi:arginine-tRNA-protein transferase
MFPSISRVQICGVNKHECGYCKAEELGKKDTSVSYGILSDVMTVEDYQSMMLLGWRRSGKYFYKPTMHQTCCPQYPIRLHVSEFKPSKSQKKVLKNVDKFLERMEDDASFSTEENLKISSVFTLQSDNAATGDVPSTSSSTKGIPKITIEMDQATFTAEKFELYRQYQMDVHKDKPEEITEKGFTRFLVDSPLRDLNTSARPDTCHVTATDGSTAYRYGTFHMLYRIQDKLIAVGVVDLLPLGLSSVYVFYDNSYKQLGLGKYTALKEIEFCAQHGFAYYFMGFYIHTCEKMKYKGEYKPSDLLCPTTLQWYPLHPHCADVLSKYRFSPLEPSLAEKRARLGDLDVGKYSVEAAARGESGNGAGESAGAATDEKSPGDVTGEAAGGAHGITQGSSDPSGGAGSQGKASASADSSAEESQDTDDEEAERVKPLAAFAPQFFTSGSPAAVGASVSTLTQTLIKAPLDVGAGQPVYLHQLRKDSITQLRPFISEWLEQVGPAIGATVAVSFC